MTDEPKNNMNPLEFHGLMTGLLIAAFICDRQTRGATSHNAIAINKYRNHCEMAYFQNRDLPVWKP